MTNSSLNRSKNTADNDEFYTYYKDIQQEVDHYIPQLKGKVVYCNCDNPFKSQYVKYFIRNFNKIGLKGLVSTCLNRTNGLHLTLHSVPIELSNATDSAIDKWVRPYVKKLKGNGGFQTPECMAIMKKCDVVITNPPFSLFLEWYQCVKKNNRRFLVLCNMNTVLTKLIIPDIVSNKVRFGWDSRNRGYKFWLPTGGVGKIGYICWLTNLKSSVKPFLPLINRPISTYPKLDNTDIIKVAKVTEIPSGYKGVMSVPITFMFKHNPIQFQIIGIADTGKGGYDLLKPYINGKQQYKSLLIRKK